MTGDGRLKGWKEIAAHLGKSISTVQRWERRFSLPVHRMTDDKGDVLFAVPAEIDEWYRSFHKSGSGGADEADSREPDRELEAQASAPATRGRWRAWVTMGAAAVLLAAAGSWLALRSRAPQSPGSEPQPADYRVEPRGLVALDRVGAPLWTYPAHGLLNVDWYPRRSWMGGSRPGVQIADIDGDGAVEVLFVERTERLGDRRLYCLDHRGKERWQYRYDRRAAVRYGDKTYEGPFFPDRVVVEFHRPSATTIWVASPHSREFPTVLQALDPAGRTTGEYWSSGHITSIAETVLDGRRVVLVGSANNETRGAGLAMLDAASFSGHGPGVRPDYVCQDCPGALPLAFVVVPRPYRFVKATGSATVDMLEPLEGGRIAATVSLGAAPSSTTVADVVYYLDGQLRPLRASRGDGFETVFHQLLAAGLATGAPSATDAELWPVLRWNGTRFEEMRGPGAPAPAGPGR